MKSKTHLLKYWMAMDQFKVYCGKVINPYTSRACVTDEGHIEELDCESCKAAIKQRMKDLVKRIR